MSGSTCILQPENTRLVPALSHAMHDCMNPGKVGQFGIALASPLALFISTLPNISAGWDLDFLIHSACYLLMHHMHALHQEYYSQNNTTRIYFCCIAYSPAIALASSGGGCAEWLFAPFICSHTIHTCCPQTAPLSHITGLLLTQW